MSIKNIRKTDITGIFILCILLLTGCTIEDIDKINPIEGDQPELLLRLQVPSPKSAVTRALTADDENDLKQIDVLVFNVQGGDTTYLYRTYGTEYNPNGNGSATVKIKVKLTGNEYHQYILFGNLRKEIDLLDLETRIGAHKKDLLKEITFNAFDPSKSEEARQWPVTGNIRPLPMWGDNGKAYQINSENTIPDIDKIQMLRAVAKVDILFSLTEENFKCTQIKLINANHKGAAVPYNSATGPGDKSDKIVYSPTLPNGTAPYPISYKAGSNSYLSSQENTIYVTEYKNKNVPTPIEQKDRMCILVKGIYDPDKNFTGDETWYRIDFFYPTQDEHGNDVEEILDILRNHHYTFIIKRIEGEGYHNENDAINSHPVNVVKEVLVWEDYDMSDVKYDGYNYYSAGPLAFSYISKVKYAGNVGDIDPKPQYDVIKIKTDSPNKYITLEYESSFYVVEPELTTPSPITDEAEIRFRVASIPYSETQYEEFESDLYIHFHDKDGVKKMSYKAVLTQTNEKPANDLNLTHYRVIPDPGGKYTAYYAYALIDGDFDYLNIRATVNILFRPNSYIPPRVLATVYPHQNDYFNDGMTGTGLPHHEGFPNSVKVKLPVPGYHGFFPRGSENGPTQQSAFGWIFEYEISPDKWVQFDRQEPHETRLYWINLYSWDRPFLSSVNEEKDWAFSISGRFLDNPFRIAIKDGRDSNARIIARYDIPPGIYSAWEEIRIEIPRSDTGPRELYVFYSETGRDEDLADALLVKKADQIWDIPEGNRQY